MSNILVFLEELMMYYFDKKDLYSASYVEALINEIYKGCDDNG